jgi:hypothetical protein
LGAEDKSAQGISPARAAGKGKQALKVAGERKPEAPERYNLISNARSSGFTTSEGRLMNKADLGKNKNTPGLGEN